MDRRIMNSKVKEMKNRGNELWKIINSKQQVINGNKREQNIR